MKRHLGFSLIENLVVVSTFAILATVGAAIFVMSLRGQNKALSSKLLRQSGSTAILAIEDYLQRFADHPDLCDGANRDRITFWGRDGEITVFSCQNGAVASNSSALTPKTVKCKNFQARCQPLSSSYPEITINFDLEVQEKSLMGTVGKKSDHFYLHKILGKKI